MPTCAAITTSGRQCARKAHRDGDGMCLQHHNANAARWADVPAHKRRNPIVAHRNAPAQAPAAAAGADADAAALADILAVAALRRVRILAENTRDIEEAPDATTNRILRIAQRSVILWSENNISGWIIPHAYACLRYKSPRLDTFPALIRAVLKFVQLSANHPDGLEFRAVPAGELTERILEIQTALVPYGHIDIETLISAADQNVTLFQNRRNREAEEHRRAEERVREAQRLQAEAERARAAERLRVEQNEEFRRALRERPVIFERDPEDSINLRAFGTDRQNIHRSSVQNATQRAVVTLLSRPVDEGQETLPEITIEFSTGGHVRWRGNRANEDRERVLLTLTDDYFNLEAFSVPYGDVLDRVWAFIRAHEHRTDLVVRLAQELSEGIGMCSNGKMAHLVNVLQGYDETIEVPINSRELFQNAIAVLITQPVDGREAAARRLFEEHNIPVGEQAAWLEPLLEV